MAILEGPMVELKQIVVEDIKKEIVAFANSEGGVLYIGIADDGRIVGVSNSDETSLQGSSSVPASASAIRFMIKETDGDTFEEMRSLSQELTFEAVTDEFKNRNITFGENQMMTLGLVNRSHIYTNLGLLLSDQCVHTIKAASFEGTTKSIFKDRREFNGSLLRQMNEAYNYIDLYNKTRAEFSKLHRIDHQDYPEEALREALLNALVHREYSFSGSTLISIFDDRIELVSLGGLVKGITMNDILFGVSQCRNEKLAAIFYRLKLIEAYGTGIQKMIDSYKNSKEKPQIESSDNAFKIILPNRNMRPQQPECSDHEKVILELFEHKEVIIRKDIENVLSISQTMAGRLLKQLVDKEVLKKVGSGKKTKYVQVAQDEK